MSVDVSVLVVTYRCREAARECLGSIYATTKDVSLEVIVLDNDSRDGTAELVREEFPQVRLLACDENLGFARGVNRAAEEARGDFLLLLNPDTVVHPGAVASLVSFARRNPQHGIYGGRTLRPDGTLDPGSCWGAPSLWSLFCFATMLSTAFKRSPIFDPDSLGRWERDSVREVDVVTGCLLLVPRLLWEELDGFDTRFFMYGEDVDLSSRARNLGFRPAITPDAEITHEVGVSSATRPDKLILLFRGKATLLRKHWRRPRRDVGLALLAAGVALRAAAAAAVSGRMGVDRGFAWPEVWQARQTWLAGYLGNAEPSRPVAQPARERGERREAASR